PFSDTCLSCHKDLNNLLESMDYVHGPVAAGYCTICHSPHKSTN
ncbi:MAG TPA: cytochrome C, partial [Flexistipes sinusarabici]|nr:cytochrome C [Flexistipes sinusarabici]